MDFRCLVVVSIICKWPDAVRAGRLLLIALALQPSAENAWVLSLHTLPLALLWSSCRSHACLILPPVYPHNVRVTSRPVGAMTVHSQGACARSACRSSSGACSHWDISCCAPLLRSTPSRLQFHAVCYFSVVSSTRCMEGRHDQHWARMAYLIPNPSTQVGRASITTGN